ncbi:hypothetical protein WJX77_000693 [Trebouxia sp. C0004]
MVEHTVKDVPRDSSTTASEAVAKSAVLPDPAYEFSAPRFYDFATNSQDLPSSERADAWFDTAGTATESQSPAKQAAQGKSAVKAMLAETSEPVDMDTDNQENQPEDDAAVQKLASNIVTSWGPVKTSKRKQPEATGATQCKHTAHCTDTGEGASQKVGGARPAKAARVEVKPALKPKGPTSAQSPRLMSTLRPRAGSQAKSTEDLQLEKAQKEAGEAAAQAAATEESRQKALGMGKPIFARSLKPLTEPKDVEFHTGKRQRMQGDAQADKGSQRPAEWKSMAQQVADFPLRSAGKSADSNPRQQQAVKPSSPKAPHFATDGRMRAVHCKSHDELEAEQMACMPHFKARPVNADVLLGTGQMSLPRADTRPLTEAHSPHLATKHRAAHQHQKVPQPSQPDQAFKAQPLNKKILEGPVFEPKHSEHTVTKAKSPQLATRTRARPEDAAKPSNDAPFVFQAKSATSGTDSRSIRSQKRKGQHRAAPGVTTSQPFQFSTDIRGEAKRAALQASLADQEAAERAGHNYKAKPVPTHIHHPTLPALPEPAFTVPEPFQLPGDALHQHAEAAKQQYLEEEEQKRKAQAAFKAQPVKVGHGVAIQPSNAPLTVPEAPRLTLNDRSASRQAFDAALAQKQKQAEAEEAAQKEARHLAEEEELREHRRNLQFKARPVPTYVAPFLPSLSGSKLTEAKSPAFCTRSRDHWYTSKEGS